VLGQNIGRVGLPDMASGGRPSLSFNFAAMPKLDERITFTRASTGTYFNSAGTLTTAAINEARFDYNPSTLAAQGLLIEESRTNSIRNNTMQGAVAGTPGTAPTNWLISTATGNLTNREIVGTGTENGIAYIDVRFVASGAFTASIYADSATGVAASNGQTWTTSFYVKLAGGSLTNVTVQTSVVENDSGGNFLAGADSATFVPTSAALSTQRFTQTRTNTNASTAFEWSRVRVSFTGAGDVTLRIGLPQLELGAFATSVIPTTTTALTRAADVASVNTLNPWYNASASTLYTEFTTPVPTSVTASAVVAGFDDGTANNRFSNFYTSNANSISANQVIATTPSFTILGASGLTLSNVQRAAARYQAGSYAMSVNGAAAVTDSFASAPPTVTTLRFGLRPSGTQANMWLRRVTVYPRGLSNAELQAITA
jgi:hypothetical protein